MNLHSKTINQLAAKEKDRADIQLEIQMLEDSTDAPDYERLAKLRSQNYQLGQEISALQAEPKPQLTIENLARIIELWTKIPASKVKAQEYDQLRHLEDRLKERIVGQDEAISAIARAIRAQPSRHLG